MIRFLTACVVALSLAGCGAQSQWADDAAVARASYSSHSPASVTLFTGVNDRNGTGSHSGLLINGSQTVLFDPAGTFSHPNLPERNDVIYGMDERMVHFYLDYHARDTEDEKFHMVARTVQVSPATAERLIRKVEANGAANKATCALTISGILRSEPEFASLPRTWFPKKLGRAFGELPGVRAELFTEANDNPGEGHGVILVDKHGRRIN